MEVASSMNRELGPVLLLLLFAIVETNSSSPPGKPALLGCRSPEKETFTCWWQPGSSGGLPTTHRLYYERERLEGVHECPDYRSAGSNSCYFDKKHTSIWVYYYLTVVASNALGNTTSDTVKLDVMDIVKPNAPENVTLQVEEREHARYLHMSWKRPQNADTKSGWVTVKYQIRVKQENNNQWKEYMSGTQTHFSLYGISPGVVYVVQVRCRLDHGSWSEWSNSTYVKVPDNLQNEKPFWILVSTVSAIPLIAAICILVMKRKYVKRCILPPVPGPRIRGVDFHQLKSGRSEDITNALVINQSFPLMVAWKDQMEEYLIVTENDFKPFSDPSNPQRRRRSSVIPADFGLESEIQCKDLMHIQSECEQAEKTLNDQGNSLNSSKFLTGEALTNMEPLSLAPIQKWENTSLNFVNVETTDMSLSVLEKHLNPLANIGYVDILTREVDDLNFNDGKVSNRDDTLYPVRIIPSDNYVDVQRQEENLSEDYSRVREVNNDNMVFLQRQNEPVYNYCTEKSSRYPDCAFLKTKNPHVLKPIKAGLCTELVDGGYVDTVPEIPSV